MEDRVRAGERGFALILAILSLMLLTFLGLTLATTTSTELQIATNYRWSQQALYNAEAGLEAARIVLSNVADTTTAVDGASSRPCAAGRGRRAAPRPRPRPGRDATSSRSDCDARGGIGYGRVVDDGAVRYENVDSFQGQTLNGAFTIWIRRPLRVNNAGEYSGRHPQRRARRRVGRRRAVHRRGRRLHARAPGGARARDPLRASPSAPRASPAASARCRARKGGSPMGENFNPCANVTPGAAAPSRTRSAAPAPAASPSTGVQ